MGGTLSSPCGALPHPRLCEGVAMSSAKKQRRRAHPGLPQASPARQTLTGSRPLTSPGTRRRTVPGDVGHIAVGLPVAGNLGS